MGLIVESFSSSESVLNAEQKEEQEEQAEIERLMQQTKDLLQKMRERKSTERIAKLKLSLKQGAKKFFNFERENQQLKEQERMEQKLR
jgi:hypothetical protein